jgi:hypothetical protein
MSDAELALWVLSFLIAYSILVTMEIGGDNE